MKSDQITHTTTRAVITAVAAALGLTTGTAQATAVTGITIEDVGSNSANGAGNFSSTLDGISGAFRFTPTTIDVASYTATSFFTGDVGTGTMLGGGAANPTGSFSTGFVFVGQQFIPFTFGGGLVADISNNALTVSTLDLGVNFAGSGNLVTPPDDGSVEVLWVNPRGNGTDYDLAFRFSHDVTTADDPSLGFDSLTAQWVIEGCATTAAGGACAPVSTVPLPAAAWLFGSGLAGFAGLARRRARAAANKTS